MNILFFLKPKNEVEFVYDDESLGEVIAKMECHSYSAIPLISRHHGTYIGTITARDLLWELKKNHDYMMQEAQDLSVMHVKRGRDNVPVDTDADMEDLIDKIINQNFVPVVDDSNIFIGIITRKDVINYLIQKKNRL